MKSVNGRPQADQPNAHLGVLLERARRRLFNRWMAEFRQAHFDDLRMSDSRAMAFLPARGARLSELAERAQMTKQSMGELVTDLERRGYVQRLPDPADGRAKLVVFTERGRAANDAALRAVASVEDEWTRKWGAERVATLRAILEEVGEAVD